MGTSGSTVSIVVTATGCSVEVLDRTASVVKILGTVSTECACELPAGLAADELSTASS